MVAVVAVLSVIWHFWYLEIENVFGTKVANKYMFDITEYSWSDIVALGQFLLAISVGVCLGHVDCRKGETVWMD